MLEELNIRSCGLKALAAALLAIGRFSNVTGRILHSFVFLRNV